MSRVFSSLLVLGGNIEELFEGGLAETKLPGHASPIVVRVERVRQGVADVVAQSGERYAIAMARLTGVPGIPVSFRDYTQAFTFLDELATFLQIPTPAHLSLMNWTSLMFSRLRMTALKALSILLRESECIQRFMSRGFFPVLFTKFSRRFSVNYLQKEFLTYSSVPMCHDESVRQKTAEAVVVPSDSYQCEVCTYINKLENKACEICGTAQPEHVAKAAAHALRPWSCQRCFFNNSTTTFEKLKAGTLLSGLDARPEVFYFHVIDEFSCFCS
jgi:hypothetical protein